MAHLDDPSSNSHSLIARANEYLQQIDADIRLLHKHCKDLYAPKFADLENLVTTPIEYARCVEVIADSTELGEHALDGIVSNQTRMNINISASIALGARLPPATLAEVL